MNKKFLMVSHLLEYSNPDISKGDIILVGRWKNSPAVVKGFGKDKNHQPVVKTSKGRYSLYRFRIAKLMKESYYPETDKYFIELWDKIKALDIPEEALNSTRNMISRSSDKIYKRYVGKIDGVKIALVNGKEVKQKIDMGFTEGSNGAAKDYCPYDEAWLDSKYDITLLKGVLFHELAERYLMTTKGYIYNDAHDFANSVERKVMPQG